MSALDRSVQGHVPLPRTAHPHPASATPPCFSHTMTTFDCLPVRHTASGLDCWPHLLLLWLGRRNQLAKALATERAGGQIDQESSESSTAQGLGEGSGTRSGFVRQC